MIYHSIHPEFKKKLTSSYQLSILAGVDSLVYFIHEPASARSLVLRSFMLLNKPSTPEDYDRELKFIMGMDELLGLPYQKVSVLLPYSHFVLVPTRLFSKENEGDYLTELTCLNDNSRVVSTSLPNLATTAVYSSIELEMVFKTHFQDAFFVHPAKCLLYGFQKLAENRKSLQVFAHLKDGNLSIAVFDESELQFYNSFKCNSSEDSLYFLTLVFDQLKLDPYLNELNLSGAITENSNMFRLLNRYFHKIGFADRLLFLDFQSQFQQVPKHHFFELFSSSLLD